MYAHVMLQIQVAMHYITQTHVNRITFDKLAYLIQFNLQQLHISLHTKWYEPSLRRIIVLVFLHTQVNIRNNCPSLYTKVIFLHEIICSPRMLFTLL